MHAERIPTPRAKWPAWLLVGIAALLVVLIVVAVNQWAGQTAESGFATGEPVTVEGCLTGSANAFVLTPTDLNPLGTALSRSADDAQATFTYELVGDASQLQPHTGQVVSVTGVIEPDVEDREEVEAESPEAPAAGSEQERTPEGEQPTVQTTEEAEIQRRRMEVQSVEPEGRRCLEGAQDGGVGTGAGEPQP